jgi:hypothetical protein
MKTITEVINEVILSEIDAVQNTHFPSIYSNKDAVALLYMLSERLRDAVHTYQLEEVKPSTGDDVIHVLEELKTKVTNEGRYLELEDHLDLDGNGYGHSYTIEATIDSYQVTADYVRIIDDFIEDYLKGFEVKESKSEESQESDN